MILMAGNILKIMRHAFHQNFMCHSKMSLKPALLGSSRKIPHNLNNVEMLLLNEGMPRGFHFAVIIELVFERI